MKEVLLCFSHQDASIHTQYDLLGSPRDLDLRSNFDLDLSRSCYTCLDASWRGKHDGVKIIALSFQTRKLSPKKLFRSKMPFFDISWPLTPKPLVLGEIWRHLSKRAFQELSIAFLDFDVAVTGTEIMRIIWSHVMQFGNLGKFCPWWPLVTSILISHKNNVSTFSRAC